MVTPSIDLNLLTNSNEWYLTFILLSCNHNYHNLYFILSFVYKYLLSKIAIK